MQQVSRVSAPSDHSIECVINRTHFHLQYPAGSVRGSQTRIRTWVAIGSRRRTESGGEGSVDLVRARREWRSRWKSEAKATSRPGAHGKKVMLERACERTLS